MKQKTIKMKQKKECSLTIKKMQRSSLWATKVPAQTAAATVTLAFHDILSRDSTYEHEV
jgi:hypothetical protein